jgi:small subunit ribosomal protein S27Ae
VPKKPPSKSKHKNVQRWKKYIVEGERIERKGRFCPRCGEGYYLAEHKNRMTCGKCGYGEIKKEGS